MRFVTDLGKGILGKPDPTTLWEDIISQIPDEVFLQTSLRILIPACGHATEADVIVKRMIALGRSVADIKDSIYLIDKYKVFTKDAICKGYTNVTKADFTDWETDMKFDVIVGNPPYQKPNGSDRMGSRGSSSLWDKFVFKGLDLLKDNGYMGIIHPPAWRKPKERFGLWKELTQNNQLVYLNMRSGRGKQDAFNIGVRFDYYVVQKTKKYKNTVVIDHENKVYNLDLENYNWLPNFAIDEISAMLGNTCNVLYNTAYHTQHKHSEKKTDDYPYPVVHTINKNGLGIKYFNQQKTDIHFGVPKVLLNQNELQYPVNDYKGEYGMSQLTFGIAINSKEDGDKIVEFLISEKGRRLIAATKWNTFYTDYNMFADFNKDWYVK